eukprot:g1639.t2
MSSSATATATTAASRFLFLTALCCSLGEHRNADVHALLAQPLCPYQQQRRRLPFLFSAASSFSNKAALPATSTLGGGSGLADTAAHVAGRLRPPHSLSMQQTSGNWEEYFSGRGSGRGGGGGGGGGAREGAAATGRRDGGGRTGSGRGGGGGGGRSRGRGGMRGGSGGGGRGGRSDFGRGRGRVGGGAGAYSSNPGAGPGGFSSRGRGRAAAGGGRGGRGRGRSALGPGYNMDDFELVEEGTGDDGSWDDFGDFSDDPARYNRPRGADTAYVEDLGTELKVVTPGRGSGFSAAPPAEAIFSSDPNLTPGAGGSGEPGRSHNRERRALQRERRRRETRDSEKGRGEQGRLWSEDDGADAAAEATKVRDGAQLRIKRREERERAERERQAAYFASLDDGEGGGGGGGAGAGGLDDLFGDYFSPSSSPSDYPSYSSYSPPKQKKPQQQEPPPPPQRFARAEGGAARDSGGEGEERTRPQLVAAARRARIRGALGVEGLEAMLKNKFSKMKEGVFKGEDDYVEFYDPDDEGFEKPLEDGEQLALVESEEDAPAGMDAGVDVAAAVQDFRGAVRYDDPDAPRPRGSGVVARSEAEAAGGGFRMRSPARAAAAAAAAAPNAGGDGEGVPGATSIEAAESPGVAVRQEKRRKAAAAAEVEERDEEGVERQEKTRKDKKRKEAEAPAKPTYTAINIADMETLEVQESVSFRDLGIDDDRLLSNVKKLGITSPTDVQVSAIRGLLEEDRDVIIHAHTGSGKTLAYLLPLIAATDPSSNALQAVVVAPGRELASQIFSVCERLIEGSGLRSAMVIGGANALRQVERVKKVKPQIVIATPGRLCELVFDRRRMKLGMVRTVVLDEVDALLRPPYDQEIDAIMDATPGGRRQAVFASATGRSPVVSAASERYMREEPLFVGGEEAAGGGQRRGGLPSNIRHTIVTMPKVKKFDTLRRLLNTQPFPDSVMIFVNDPIQVNWLTERLETVGIIAAPLSGESSKDDRAEIMRRLQDKRISMVVTTEMAARGLDVAHLTHVVNYDLPTDADHYVHRAGRCGRAGRPGIVVNMATPDVKFVLGKFAKSLALPFDDAEIQGGRFWSVSRAADAPPAPSAARAEVAAAKATGAEAGAAVDGETENAVAGDRGSGSGSGTGSRSGAVAVGGSPRPARVRPSSPVDKGFLGDPVVVAADRLARRGKQAGEGGDSGVLSLRVDGEDDILAEARAFLEGGGGGGAGVGVGAEAGPVGVSPLPSHGPPGRQESEGFDDDGCGGEVYVDAADDDATAEAAAFLGGGQGRGVGAAAAAAEAVATSKRSPPPPRKEIEAVEAARSSGEDDGPSADLGRARPLGIGETFEVAGGLAIVHTAEPLEGDGGDSEEGDWGWDEDDWGDGDWGESGEEEEEGEDEEEEGGEEDDGA